VFLGRSEDVKVNLLQGGRIELKKPDLLQGERNRKQRGTPATGASIAVRGAGSLRREGSLSGV